MLRKLLLATVVAMLAVVGTALAVQHATGTFTGRTTQRLPIRLDVGARTIRGGSLQVSVVCTGNGRRRVLRDAATLASGGIHINANGTWGARERARRGDFRLAVAGRVAGRRVSGRYEEQFTSRYGVCRSGRIHFTASR